MAQVACEKDVQKSVVASLAITNISPGMLPRHADGHFEYLKSQREPTIRAEISSQAVVIFALKSEPTLTCYNAKRWHINKRQQKMNKSHASNERFTN